MMQSTGLAVGLAQLNSRQLGGLARPYIRGCGGILSVQKTPFSHAGQAMPSLLALAPNAAPQAAQPSCRPMRSADLPAVLALNQAALPAVSHLDMDGLGALCASALEVIVAEQAGQVEAFLVLYGPGQKYASQNYRWFCQRYADLVYIDRIVLAPSVQRQGLGRSLYNDAMAMASARQVPLVCEVNTRPRNEGSLAFHERLGFHEVGRQQTEGGAKEVAMLAWQ